MREDTYTQLLVKRNQLAHAISYHVVKGWHAGDLAKDYEALTQKIKEAECTQA